MAGGSLPQLPDSVARVVARGPASGYLSPVRAVVCASIACAWIAGSAGAVRGEDAAGAADVDADVEDADAEPHWWRAAIEEASALAAGTTWYWLDRERQVADWDYPSVKDRLTFEAWRYDNNPFPINFAWHAFNGTGFHVIARSNDLSLLEAAGYGFMTSMAWEYLLEFREKVSINDVIVTPVTGISTGELFHWLGVYLNSSQGNSTGHDIARWTFAPLHSFHDSLDDRTRRLSRLAERDNLGLTTAIWHRFRVAYGYGSIAANIPGADDSLQMHEIRLDARLVAFPGYLRPGALRRGFREGNVTSANLRITPTEDGMGWDFAGDTILAGWHAQDIPADGGLGRAITLGTSIGYRYRFEKIGAWKDRLGIAELPGLAVDADLLGRRWGVHAGARAHADFAGLHAIPYREWKDANGDAVEKTILAKHGYYYGWGWSTALTMELSLPRVSLGAALHYGRYYSDEGLDRNQEEILDDIESSDTVRDVEAWLRVAPLGGALYLEARVNEQERNARLDDVSASQSLRRYSIGLGAVF